jgi:long-chain acyl-CoA synthetase
VKAFVVLKDDARCGESELNAFLRERLTAYKIPRSIEFRTELPTSGAGKLLRRALREQAGR